MILHTTPSAYIISHPDSIKYSVNNCDPVDLSQNKGHTHRLNPSLFEIHKPFISNTHKNLGSLALQIESIYKEEVLPYFETLNKELDLRDTEDKPEKDNSVAVQAAKRFFAEGDYDFEKFHGANPTEHGVISKFQGRSYLFPPRSRFYNCDLFTHQFEEEDHDKYDLVVMDPPWKNKFIKRRKGNCMGYDTHSTDDIQNLQIGYILKNQGILAIWSTNSKTENILNEMLGKWGLLHLTTLYWLKVTTQGRLTVPFTKEGGKQPFESLILATKSDIKEVKTTKLIISTPSAIHSHKFPLTEVLEDYFQRKFQVRCELFARYLLPNYTSYGNQVLKLNNCILFEDML